MAVANLTPIAGHSAKCKPQPRLLDTGWFRQWIQGRASNFEAKTASSAEVRSLFGPTTQNFCVQLSQLSMIHSSQTALPCFASPRSTGEMCVTSKNIAGNSCGRLQNVTESIAGLAGEAIASTQKHKRKSKRTTSKNSLASKERQDKKNATRQLKVTQVIIGDGRGFSSNRNKHGLTKKTQ